MMALLPIILCVTTAIYEKVKIPRLKCEKTDMLLIYGEFSIKLFVFFTISLNQANDVYVKIYETAQLTMFYVF
jgi:hypothetical protein